MPELEKSLNRLKNNKSKDPHGMKNELFKEGYIGFDLKTAVLSIMNQMAENMTIPEFITFANITSINKSNSLRTDMENQRGIFGLSILKKVLDYILFEEYYKDIDVNMSESNIGGRKKEWHKTTCSFFMGL